MRCDVIGCTRMNETNLSKRHRNDILSNEDTIMAPQEIRCDIKGLHDVP